MPFPHTLVSSPRWAIYHCSHTPQTLPPFPFSYCPVSPSTSPNLPSPPAPPPPPPRALCPAFLPPPVHPLYLWIPAHSARRLPLNPPHHGASRLVQAMPAWLVKTRRALPRHSRDARVYGHTTTAMSKLSTPPSRTYGFPYWLERPSVALIIPVP